MGDLIQISDDLNDEEAPSVVIQCHVPLFLPPGGST